MRCYRLTLVLAFLGLLAGGCGNVRRTITITSEPANALVWLNGREIGRTPVTVDFIYYGVYDVQLVADGYEPLLTDGRASPPLWDQVPLDLASELTPFEKHARIEWHYQLAARDDDPERLVERARQLRGEIDMELPRDVQPVVDNESAAAQPPAAE